MELSRALDEQLEKTDPIETPYILEVSSPGLDRPLKTEKDFVRSHGKLVEVKLYKAMKEKGVEKEFTALLKGYDPKAKSVVLELEHGAAICLDQKEIASIRLAVIF
ncbi:MAG: ribosome maturation factor RimP [Bianqueaceae bacterium]